MTKLIRLMDEPTEWVKYADNHFLKINKRGLDYFENALFDENNDVIFEKYYEVTFDIYNGSHLLSSVSQKIHPTLKENQLLNNQRDNITLIHDYLKLNDHLSYSQSLFLTYLNDEESRLFKKNVGEPILMLKKKVFDYQKLVLYEEELAQIDAYIFKEGKF